MDLSTTPKHRLRFLITGASSPNALALARLLSSNGHAVIAAAHEPLAHVSPARYSRAISKFHRLTCPADPAWVSTLRIDIWIPFDSIPNREEVAQYDYEVIGRKGGVLNGGEAFEDFMRRYVRHAMQGLSFEFGEKEDVLRVLRDMEQEQGPTNSGVIWQLQRKGERRTEVTISECQTYSTLSKLIYPHGMQTDAEIGRIVNRLGISTTSPGVMREMPVAGERYTVHALIIYNHIQTFMITKRVGQKFLVIDPGSALTQLLYLFTVQFITAWVVDVQVPLAAERNMVPRDRMKEFEASKVACTSHLNIEFLVSEKRDGERVMNQVLALNCNTKPHDSIILFASNPSTKTKLAKLYASVKDEAAAQKRLGMPLLYAMGGKRVVGIWSVPGVVGDVLGTVGGILTCRPGAFGKLGKMVRGALRREERAKEEMWEGSDPVPAFVRYLVEMPVEKVKGRGGKKNKVE